MLFWQRCGAFAYTHGVCSTKLTYVKRRLHTIQARAVAEESPAFVTALNGLPLVLMSEGSSATEVLKSIELGAVEYIEKPLSLLKLRNIWQHVVRKVRSTDANLLVNGAARQPTTFAVFR